MQGATYVSLVIFFFQLSVHVLQFHLIQIHILQITFYKSMFYKSMFYKSMFYKSTFYKSMFCKSMFYKSSFYKSMFYKSSPSFINPIQSLFYNMPVNRYLPYSICYSCHGNDRDFYTRLVFSFSYIVFQWPLIKNK